MSLDLKDCGEHKMYLIKKDRGISRTLRKPSGYQKREIEFMTLIRNELKEGELACDIGANIGYVTLIMAKLVGEKGRIVSIEPDPTNIKVLEKNVELNNYTERVELHHAGISDIDGKLPFKRSDKSNLGKFQEVAKSKSLMVPVMSLDSLFANRPIPTFYKMDVEGHEVKVLRGMRTIASKAPSGTKILIEVHPQFYNKTTLNFEPELRTMISLGFGFKFVISAAVGCPKLFKERGYQPKKVYESSGWYRGVYDDIQTEDAIYFCSHSHHEYVPRRKRTTKKIVRAIMLEKV